MSYKIVDKKDLPKESKWTGDARLFIQEGCVQAWACQVPYGRQCIVATYTTPKGETVYVEKYEEKRITREEVSKTLKDAGY